MTYKHEVKLTVYLQLSRSKLCGHADSCNANL